MTSISETTSTSTLDMIGVSVMGGSAVCITTIIVFGFVLRQRHIYLAPRATARPRDVIYNPSARSSVNNNKGKVLIDRHVQDRGNPFIGWIGWTLSLRYDQMLRGIPGTGTRQNGLTGTMLSVTLDGIILLRFHDLGLRISLFVTILSLVILMPLYATSDCTGACDLGDLNTTDPYLNTTSYSTYKRLTMLNIPPLLSSRETTTKEAVAVGSIEYDPAAIRLYGVVVIFWIIMVFVFRELRREWIQILALRRVYYLEYDIYGERQKQLERTRLFTNSLTTVPTSGSDAARVSKSQKQVTATATRNNTLDDTTKSKQKLFQKQQEEEESDELLEHSQPFVSVPSRHEQPTRSSMVASLEEPHLVHREPYIPHPEFVETVPNVSIYSVLVGGLPSLPRQDTSTGTSTLMNDHNKAAHDQLNVVFSKREQVDWQLSLTTAFFDHCVPNQPGFSSSIAAVTIIPGAKAMANAWKKWSIAATSLRKLRFLDEQIAYKQALLQKEQEEEEIFIPEYLADEYLFDEKLNENDNKTAKQGTDSTITTTKRLIPSSLKCDTRRTANRVLSNRSVLGDIESGFQVIPKLPNKDFSSPSASSPDCISPLSEGMSLVSPCSTACSPSGNSPVPTSDYIHKTAIDNNRTDNNTRLPDRTQAYYQLILGSFVSGPSLADVDHEKENKHNDIYDKNEFGGEKGNLNENSLANEPLAFGPEQSAVYSREFAQVASGCNPNGFCCERRITRMTLEELLILKKIVAEETMRAYNDLKEARDKAAVFSDYASKDVTECTRHGSYQVQQEVEDNFMTTTAIDEHEPPSLPIVHQGDDHDGSNQKTDDSIDGSCNAQSTSFLYHSFHDLPLDRDFTEHKNPTQQKSTAHHRSQLSFENMRLPSDLGLEAHLVRKTTGNFDTKNTISSKVLLASNHTKLDESCASIAAEGSLNAQLNSPQRKAPLQLRNPTRLGMQHTKQVSSSTESSSKSSRSFAGTSRSKMHQNHDVDENLQDPELPSSNELSAKHATCNVSNIVTKNHSSEMTDNMTDGASQFDRSLRNDDFMANEAPFSLALGGTDHTDNDPTFARKLLGSMSTSRWEQVRSIVDEAFDRQRSRSTTVSSLTNGAWNAPSFQELVHDVGDQLRRWFREQKNKAVDTVARDSTFAVVTFTSRQAAVAARACVADGRGHRRWLTLQEIPIPPLADAPAWDPGFTACRNCCQPVTISINEQQKTFRHLFSILLLGFIYVFYTVPLTLASQLVEPQSMQKLFPDLNNRFQYNVSGLISGLLTAGIWSTFFTICPTIFTAIANFGSKATSVAHAEYNALSYFWWFMVLTAFAGQTMANMGIKGLSEGFQLGSDFKSVLNEIATTIPTVTAVTWLNWILFRFLIILPLNYLLMINTFIFDMIGLQCCSRVLRGGGPGPGVPYRLYVDSGMVFLCLMAISPVAPIIAPPCFFYFLFCQPLLRRNLIFVYRPQFDGGGNRWPFIFRMFISAMIVGEILLTCQMVLKQATGPAIFAGLSLAPTFLFEYEMRKRYLRSFEDAALCQTSMLDGWYDESEFTFSKREAFRRFLVDAHKAAYVPVCLASPDTESFLTAEPAVVVPRPGEDMPNSESELESGSLRQFLSQRQLSVEDEDKSKNSRVFSQHGVSLRRASLVLSSLDRALTPVSGDGNIQTPNEPKRTSFRNSTERLDKVEEGKED